MDIEELKEYLTLRLGFCEEALKDTCLNLSSDFKKLIETKKEDLPLLLNVGGALGEWASKRLKTDEWETPECYIEFLSNTSMNYTQYRDVGINEGELACLKSIFLKLDMGKEAQRAYCSIYSCD